MRKLILVLMILIVVACASVVPALATTQQSDKVVTLSDIGTAVIAGTDAYYDDGMLSYAHAGNTIGYVFDQSDSTLEFDLIFNQLQHPSWLSLTLKANGFDRTQSPNLSQKGYSFVIFASGVVQVWKEGLSGVESSITNFSPFEKNRIQIGAYNVGSSVKLYLKVNQQVVIDYTDSTNAYLTGDWFNICGDGSVSARLFSTKNVVIPDYYTYTLSTLEEYPNIPASGGATVDIYNNIQLSWGTVGFYQALQNYSVEFNCNWQTFAPGSNVWVSMRAGGFDRANSPNLGENKGYSFRIGQTGAVEIYKNGNVLTTGGWAFKLNEDYLFEFGTVDLSSTSTLIFVNINGVPAASAVDDENPLQNRGWLNINGDGTLLCDITSVNTKLTPLRTKVNSVEQKVEITTYFNNTISYTDMQHDDFSQVLLDAIQVNGYSVSDFNKLFYGLDGLQKVNAATVRYEDNRLVICVSKNIYKVSNDEKNTFIFDQLVLKKTGADAGMICPSGYVLKQTYYFNAK